MFVLAFVAGARKGLYLCVWPGGGSEISQPYPIAYPDLTFLF